MSFYEYSHTFAVLFQLPLFIIFQMRQYIALADYESTNPDDLSIKKGDILTIYSARLVGEKKQEIRRCWYIVEWMNHYILMTSVEWTN